MGSRLADDVLDKVEGTTFGAHPDCYESSPLSRQKKKTVWGLVLLLVSVMVLAYFGRPRPPVLEIVSPRQELPEYEERLPGDTLLADQVVKSYGLAMVLVQTPYTQKNVVALESLRSWARDRFQKQPDFLHPVSLSNTDEPRSGLLDAACYNLFAGPKYFIEEQLGEVLSWRIAAFHNTNAYMSFRNAFFDLFGLSNDSAILLARYQTDRAKLAIDALLWALPWTVAIAYGAFFVFSKRYRARYDAAQRVLANGWLLLSGMYTLTACMQNQLSLLVSAILAASLGVYLRKPFKLSTTNGVLRFELITLTFDWIALAYWLSYSLLCVQVLTWIRLGGMNDPVTLLLSSFTGNFLQEPLHAKRTITQIAALSWVAVFAWTVSQLAGDAKAASETEESLASL